MNTKTAFILILVLIIAGSAYLLWDNVYRDQTIGGERDEHGCLGPAGYQWCEAKQQCQRFWEEKCDNEQVKSEIEALVDNIKQETGVVFTTGEEGDMEWNYEDEEEIGTATIYGVAYFVENITHEAYENVINFFEDASFKEDVHNAIDGSVIGGRQGYRKAITVCVLTHILSDYDDEWSSAIPESDNKDLELMCGLLEKDSVPEISKEKRIRKILAEKYEMKASEIEISISQESEHYLRGGITLVSDEFDAGMFLATDINGDWEVVFDGEGSFECDEMEQLGFPMDMISDCVESVEE